MRSHQHWTTFFLQYDKSTGGWKRTPDHGDWNWHEDISLGLIIPVKSWGSKQSWWCLAIMLFGSSCQFCIIWRIRQKFTLTKVQNVVGKLGVYWAQRALIAGVSAKCTRVHHTKLSWLKTLYNIQYIGLYMSSCFPLSANTSVFHDTITKPDLLMTGNYHRDLHLTVLSVDLYRYAIKKFPRPMPPIHGQSYSPKLTGCSVTVHMICKPMIPICSLLIYSKLL